MIVIIVLSLLLIGIAFFQALQGLFSALVMALLTTASVAVALNYFEPVGDLLASNLGIYAYAAALLALFVIPLYILREIFDRVIRGNVVLGLWPDRIGGGLLGTYSAFLMVGMLSLVMQLLPWNESMMGWQGYDSFLAPSDGATPRWAADFFVGVGQRLSDGAFSGDRSLLAAHADLAQDAFAAQNRLPGASPDAPASGVTVEGAFSLADPEKPDQKFDGSEEDRTRLNETVPLNPLLEGSAATRVYIVRTDVSGDVARLEKDNWWRLSGTQFRLVGQDDRSYYPVGYLSYSGGWKLNTSLAEGGSNKVEMAKLSVGRPVDLGASLRVDWVYRLPAKVKPAYLVFRGALKLPVESLAYGMPKPLDDKGTALALSAKPREGTVKFDSVSGRFLRPEGMDSGGNMPRNMSVSIGDEKALPKGVSDLELTPNRGLKKITVLDAPMASLSAAASTAQGGIRCYNMGGAPGMDIVSVSIDLDPAQQASMEAVRAKLSQLKPVLLLSDGTKVGHRGIYLEYKEGETYILAMYYDTARADNPPTPVDEFFIKSMSDNLAHGERFGVYFNVPEKANLAAVGVDLGIGRDGEMFLPAPLLTANRSR